MAKAGKIILVLKGNSEIIAVKKCWDKKCQSLAVGLFESERQRGKCQWTFLGAIVVTNVHPNGLPGNCGPYGYATLRDLSNVWGTYGSCKYQ